MANDESVESLATALPKEMARVRDEIMPPYLAIGDAGKPALFLMRRELDAATKAMMEGDTIAMMRCLLSLRQFTD